MSSLILRNFLLDDIIDIIVEYNLPTKNKVEDDIIDFELEINKIFTVIKTTPGEIPLGYIYKYILFEVFHFQVNKFLRHNVFHLGQTHKTVFNTLKDLFDDAVFKKMMNFIKKYKSYGLLVNYNRIDEFQYLLKYTKDVIKITKKKQEVFKDNKCLGITAKGSRCGYKRKYDYYCGVHNKVNEPCSILEIINISN